MPAPEVVGVAPPTEMLPFACKFPDELIRMASAPPSAKAIVSAAGKNNPVLVSPEVVIDGKETLPAPNARVLLDTLILTFDVGVKVRPELLAVRMVTLPTFRLICEPADSMISATIFLAIFYLKILSRWNYLPPLQ